MRFECTSLLEFSRIYLDPVSTSPHYIACIMADNIPQLIKIGVSLKTTPNNGAVYFKSDGTRFGQSRTIKLLTGTKYKIDVVVKPGAVQAT